MSACLLHYQYFLYFPLLGYLVYLFCLFMCASFQTKSSFYGEISSQNLSSKLVLLTLHFPRVSLGCFYFDFIVVITAIDKTKILGSSTSFSFSLFSHLFYLSFIPFTFLPPPPVSSLFLVALNYSIFYDCMPHLQQIKSYTLCRDGRYTFWSKIQSFLFLTSLTQILV